MRDHGRRTQKNQQVERQQTSHINMVLIYTFFCFPTFSAKWCVIFVPVHEKNELINYNSWPISY